MAGRRRSAERERGGVRGRRGGSHRGAAQAGAVAAARWCRAVSTVRPGGRGAAAVGIVHRDPSRGGRSRRCRVDGLRRPDSDGLCAITAECPPRNGGCRFQDLGCRSRNAGCRSHAGVCSSDDGGRGFQAAASRPCNGGRRFQAAASRPCNGGRGFQAAASRPCNGGRRFQSAAAPAGRATAPSTIGRAPIALIRRRDRPRRAPALRHSAGSTRASDRRRDPAFLAADGSLRARGAG
jgi:hypothetical protein